jgi:hypothetical protein
VVAILATLAAISASALAPMVGRYRQMVAAEAVAQLVSEARVEAVVPGAFTEPEFRPNGYTQDLLDTELQVGPAGAPTTRITIRSYGPICAEPMALVRPCP